MQCWRHWSTNGIPRALQYTAQNSLQSNNDEDNARTSSLSSIIEPNIYDILFSVSVYIFFSLKPFVSVPQESFYKHREGERVSGPAWDTTVEKTFINPSDVRQAGETIPWNIPDILNHYCYLYLRHQEWMKNCLRPAHPFDSHSIRESEIDDNAFIKEALAKTFVDNIQRDLS